MIELFPILASLTLARGEDDFGSIIKVIFWVIVIVSWIVSAIAKSVKKQQPQAPTPQESWVPEQPPPTDAGVQPAPPPQQQWHPAPPPQYQPTPPPQWHPQTVQPWQQTQSSQPVAVPPQWLGQSPQAAPPPIPKKQRVKKSAVVVAPVEEIDEALVYTSATPIDSDVPSRPGRAASTPASKVTAKTLRGWLTPETLRRQYPVTELFDRPPSDRPS